MKFTVLFSIILFSLSVIAGPTLFKEGSINLQAVSIGDSAAADSKSLLDIKSTTKGILFPRMTSTQMNAISSPTTGLMVWNTTAAGLYQYNGSSWVPVGTLSPLTTKGDLYVYGTTNDRLPIGTNNYTIIADSAQSLGLKWGQISLTAGVTGTLPIANGGTGQTTAIAAYNALSPVTTKGDLIGTNGTTSARVAVGADGQALVADSASTNGFKWSDVAVTTQGRNEGAAVSTTKIRAPFNQFTTTGTNERLILTGNDNMLANPGFEHSTGGTGWSAIAWTGSGSSGSDSTSNNAHAGSLKSYKIVATADYSVGFIYQDVTPDGDFSGQLLEHGIWYKTTDMQYMWVCPRQGGTTLTGLCMPFLSLDGKWNYAYATSVGPAAGTSIGMAVYGSAVMTGTTYLDDAYTGLFRRGGDVMSKTSGGLKYAGTANCLWNRSGTTLGFFGADTDCPTPTVTGSASAPSTKIPGIVMTNVPAGTCTVTAKTAVSKTGTQDATVSLALTDNITEGAAQVFYANTTNGAYVVPVTLVQKFYYSSFSNSLQFEVKGQSDNASNSVNLETAKALRDFEIYVECEPSAKTNIQSTNSMRGPTYTVLTSGTSATYTPPTGVARIEVEVYGPGGGGSGGGATSTMGSGSAGSAATTFGAQISAGAGGGGSANGGAGAGGTGTCGSQTNCKAFDGATGGQGGFNNGAQTAPSSGIGGSSPLGGAGGNGVAQGPGAGVTAKANTGSGGGGGGTGNGVTGFGGGGGGAGAYVKAIIDNPTATTYTIGTGGSGGTLGTTGAAGGNGAAGVIIIKEIYGVNIPPMKAGVIAQDNPGGVTTINTVVSKTTTYTASINEDTIEVNATGGAWTLALPAAAGVKGKKYLIRSVGSGSNAVTIDPNGSETICGLSTVKLFGGQDYMNIYSDGTNWKSTECTRTVGWQVAAGCTLNNAQFPVTVSSNGTGDCANNFPSGAFSDVPYNCVISVYNGSDAVQQTAKIHTLSASAVRTMTYNGSATLTNYAYSVTCSGMR